MKKKKVLIIALLLMAIFLMATGCRENEGMDIDVEDDQDQVTDENDNDMSLNNGENQEDQNANAEEKEGTFVGWIDGNSFEMDIDGETVAIRNEDNIEIPEDLDGKDVKVKLRKNAMNQYVITSFEPMTP